MNKTKIFLLITIPLFLISYVAFIYFLESPILVCNKYNANYNNENKTHILCATGVSDFFWVYKNGSFPSEKFDLNELRK